jgi:hypothetical protein
LIGADGFIGEKSPAALFADIGIDRQQKAWFLLAAQAQRACGAFGAGTWDASQPWS